MPKLFVQNLSEAPVCLALEPWAEAEILPPETTAEIEYDEDYGEGKEPRPDDVVGVSLMPDGSLCVSMIWDSFRVTINGEEKISWGRFAPARR